MKAQTVFDKVTITTNEDVVYRIRCIKGLWSVEGRSKTFVNSEATHYFMQYFLDGEYDEYI